MPNLITTTRIIKFASADYPAGENDRTDEHTIVFEEGDGIDHELFIGTRDEADEFIRKNFVTFGDNGEYNIAYTQLQKQGE